MKVQRQSSYSLLHLPGRAGQGRRLAHGRPWLPRGGATALRGRATELMGDVIIFLLSKTQNSRRDKKEEEKERRGLKKKMKVEESGGAVLRLAARCQCLRVWLLEGRGTKIKVKQRPGGT